MIKSLLRFIKMKKLSLIISIAMACLSLGGCNSSNQNTGEYLVHTHTFSTDWSCDEDYHWHAATCGHNVVKGKAPHQYGEWIIDKEPTKTEDGRRHQICAICEHVHYENYPLPPHIHVPLDPVIENTINPTCTNGGSYELVVYCAECGEVVSRERVDLDALDHDYKLIGHQDPTYLEEGYDEYKCERCDHTYVEPIPKLKYTVIFNSDGGSEVETQHISHGDKIEEPEPPTKDGFTFSYWSYNSQPWDFATFSVTSDITLLAIWE